MSDYDDEIAQLLRDNFILEDLSILLISINEQIKQVEIEAETLGVKAIEMRTRSGDWTLRSLLCAKANTLNAITVLKSMSGYVDTLALHTQSENSA